MLFDARCEAESGGFPIKTLLCSLAAGGVCVLTSVCSKSGINTSQIMALAWANVGLT